MKTHHIILLAIISLLLIGIIYFKLPSSPLKTEFEQAEKILNEKYAHKLSGNITTKDIETLPQPVQKYFINNGFINKPKMNIMRLAQRHVPFKQSKDKALTIDYYQFNYASAPARIARIDSGLFGIPFDGLDYLDQHDARMVGKIAKNITMFDYNSEELLQGAMLTYLSEALIMPSIAIQPFITWEAIDDFHAKATLTYDTNKSVSGIFTFNSKYEMETFYTEKRGQMQADGSSKMLPWTAKLMNYKVNSDGYNLPNKLQAIWHQEDGDVIYFDSDNLELEYK